MSAARTPSKSTQSAEPHTGCTLVLAGIRVFATALDNPVVATALPVLRVSLHARLSDTKAA